MGEELIGMEESNTGTGLPSLDLSEYPDKEELSRTLEDKLDTINLGRFFSTPQHKSLQEELISLYKENDYEMFWSTSTGITSQAEDLLELIPNISDEGLNPEHYHPQEIRESVYEMNSMPVENLSEAIVELDLLLTTSYLILASDIATGRLNPHKFENRWIPDTPEKDLKEYFVDAYQEDRIGTSIKELVPEQPQYHKLKEALHYYRGLRSSKNWKKFKVDSVLQMGDTGQIITRLAERLIETRDLKEVNNIEKSYFGPEMEASVKLFQKRHGIPADGVVGPETFRKLNITLEEKIRQIMLNMERLRWRPRSMGDQYILVNVPEFKLRIYENEEIIDEMKVIVGREYNSTPIFSDTLEYLVFSPDWTVPISIVRQSLWENIVDDPEYLTRNHYDLFLDWDQNSALVDPHAIDWENLSRAEYNYKLVQRPGPWNALGQVKFMMPNDMAIYLHDTPQEYLFESEKRGFSHGCIRVERPLDLAAYLLRNDPGWDNNKINQHLTLDQPHNVVLPEKMPVHIVYKTTWVDDEGYVNFLSDIYNHDEIQLASLEKSLDLE